MLNFKMDTVQKTYNFAMKVKENSFFFSECEVLKKCFHNNLGFQVVGVE